MVTSAPDVGDTSFTWEMSGAGVLLHSHRWEHLGDDASKRETRLTLAKVILQQFFWRQRQDPGSLAHEQSRTKCFRVRRGSCRKVATRFLIGGL